MASTTRRLWNSSASRLIRMPLPSAVFPLRRSGSSPLADNRSLRFSNPANKPFLSFDGTNRVFSGYPRTLNSTLRGRKMECCASSHRKQLRRRVLLHSSIRFFCLPLVRRRNSLQESTCWLPLSTNPFFSLVVTREPLSPSD